MRCLLPAIPAPLLATGGSGFSPAHERIVNQWVKKALAGNLPTVAPRAMDEEQRSISNRNEGIFVGINCFQYASFERPLGTLGLATCSGLAILDPDRRCHYLGHVMPISQAPFLINTLWGFSHSSFKQPDVFILPGEVPGIPDAARESLTNVFSTLLFLDMIDHVTMVTSAQHNEYRGLILSNGELFNFDALTSFTTSSRLQIAPLSLL